MTTERIYISGPMSGIEDFNFRAFNAAAKRLRDAGLDVVNPAEINVDTKLGWHECLRKDMAALAECTTLALLPGWQNSNGAHLELHVAHRLGMRIVLIEDLLAQACGPMDALGDPVAYACFTDDGAIRMWHTRPFDLDNTPSMPLYTWRQMNALLAAATGAGEVGDDQAKLVESVIRLTWRCAMTAACNVVIKIQNRLNDDDGDDDAIYELGKCIREIKPLIEIDSEYMDEVLAIRNASQESQQ